MERDSLLRRIEKIRGRIPARLGLRRTTVEVMRRVYTGDVDRGEEVASVEMVGELANDGTPPRVQQVTQRDVLNSGGVVQAGDYLIGPLTPSHPLGGTEASDVNPDFIQAQTNLYRLDGGGFDSVLCEKVGERFDTPFSMTFILRRIQ